MDDYEAGDRLIRNSMDLAIIREIYDGENAHEAFEIELDRALEANCECIVIEPSKLGEETATWISFGNYLHKTAIFSGFGSILSNIVWPDRMYIGFPLGGISLFCTGLYAVCWQTDPCCKYKVETNPQTLEKLPLHTLHSSSPVVLIQKDDTNRFVLHTAITIIAVAVCAFRIYKSYTVV